MKKTAQLLKSHLKGHKTAESEKIMQKIAGMLKDFGFKGPFVITKVSGFLDLDKSSEDTILDEAYVTLGIVMPGQNIEENFVRTQDEILGYYNEQMKSCLDLYKSKGSDPEQASLSYQACRKRTEDAKDTVFSDLMTRTIYELKTERDMPQRQIEEM